MGRTSTQTPCRSMGSHRPRHRRSLHLKRMPRMSNGCVVTINVDVMDRRPMNYWDWRICFDVHPSRFRCTHYYRNCPMHCLHLLDHTQADPLKRVYILYNGFLLLLDFAYRSTPSLNQIRATNYKYNYWPIARPIPALSMSTSDPWEEKFAIRLARLSPTLFVVPILLMF